jgi:hypothetical protein
MLGTAMAQPRIGTHRGSLGPVHSCCVNTHESFDGLNHALRVGFARALGAAFGRFVMPSADLS